MVVRCYKCYRVIEGDNPCSYCASRLQEIPNESVGAYESFPILVLRGLYVIILGCFALLTGMFALIPTTSISTINWLTILGVYLWTFLPAFLIGLLPPKMIYPPPFILKIWYVYILVGGIYLYF